MSGRHFRLATLIKMTKLTKTQTKRFKKWIGSWTFLGTKVEGTGLAIGVEQHLADELSIQREDFSKAIDKAVEEERERVIEVLKKINAYGFKRGGEMYIKEKDLEQAKKIIND